MKVFSVKFLIFCLFVFSACSQRTDTISTAPQWAIFNGEQVIESSVLAKNTVLIVATYYDVSGKQGAAGCTGIVVTKRHILTAAHCIYKNNSEMRSVTHYVIQKADLAGATRGDYIYAPKYRIHESYDGRSGSHVKNDIAVLLLDRELKGALPAKLAVDNSEFLPLKEVYVAGHGRHNENLLDHKLRVTQLTLAEIELSKEVWLKPSKGCPLQGDSGGPAFILGNDGTPLVIGVASTLSGESSVLGPCREYARYSLVSEYQDFIREALKELQ
ncbi:MAG: hypothetical protein OM95_07980 [Bdellovibrio sp. ArHS]|uniref:S1 family peptidase n=1 Tax=Bdellovibrio sp. ArHS TaxID=1569284 RepID=UPI000582C72A|nr:trypsin-like serine protease [Bdellovibrio sp. ArHS]KHD88724.1 MAG: hypothetical protein OM95_07980 [Bdellovibrio sp. ArHS]